MLRTLSAFALLAGASALAHDHQATPAPAPQATPAPAPDAAALNARVNAALPADQAAMKAHVLFLASDALKGREAGTPEFDIAAQYVAAQFYAAGLRPGGDQGSYLQDVPLVSYRLDGPAAATWTPAKGRAVTLVTGEDFAALPDPTRARTALSAPVVFAGHGVVAPQYGRDDYAGADVRGKIVAVFNGAPASFGGEERAFFGSPATKAELAAARGAVGLIVINTPATARARPLKAVAAAQARPRMTWARPDGTGHAAGAPQLGTMSIEGATKIFGPAWAEFIDFADQPSAPPRRAEAAAGVLTIAARTRFEPARSSNVVGVIPGSDPKLKDEVVVLSAHLDHIGVNPTGTGDRINNGAMDDAVGIASLIEEAKRFKADRKPPRRAVMFLAVTAEEKGLVGSDYFARHPTVPIGNVVADVNLDMPILTYRFEDLIVFGADRSTLGPIVRRAAKAEGVAVSADPIPEQGIFVRSDHFRFVQQGVPSVFLWPGQKGPGKAAYDEFFARHYHKPSDEVSLPIDWSQGVRFISLNYAIAREIADADRRPVWNRGDYFGTLYKGPMAK